MNPKYKDVGTVEDRAMEECAELIKAICKSKRFGLANYHPERPQVTNRMLILEEIADVQKTVERLKNFMSFPCRELDRAEWCDAEDPGKIVQHFCNGKIST